MQNKRIWLILVVMALAGLISCAPMKKTRMIPDRIIKDLTPAFQSGELDSKVDGLLVLMDASSSMAQAFGDYAKFDIARAFVRRMNNTLPPISAVSGLRTFGHAPELTLEQTKLFYGMTPYNRRAMDEGLARVTPSGGPTPMTSAINEAGRDLKDISGHKVIILVSDGKDLDNQPLEAAQKLQSLMGDQLCIYTVMVGDDAKGKVLMEKIARVSPCGFMIQAQDTESAQSMADYVSDVFLNKRENMSETAQSENKQDMSIQGTGLGYHKAEPLLENLGNIHFDFDSSDLTKEGRLILDQHIRLLKDNPDVNIRIAGYASAHGTKEHNQRLSEKRAARVLIYMVNVGKISSKRLSSIGYGETRPAVLEPRPWEINSREARANMRVAFDIIKN